MILSFSANHYNFIVSLVVKIWALQVFYFLKLRITILACKSWGHLTSHGNAYNAADLKHIVLYPRKKGKKEEESVVYLVTAEMVYLGLIKCYPTSPIKENAQTVINPFQPIARSQEEPFLKP